MVPRESQSCRATSDCWAIAGNKPTRSNNEQTKAGLAAPIFTHCHCWQVWQASTVGRSIIPSPLAVRCAAAGIQSIIHPIKIHRGGQSELAALLALRHLSLGRSRGNRPATPIPAIDSGTMCVSCSALCLTSSWCLSIADPLGWSREAGSGEPNTDPISVLASGRACKCGCG